MGVALAQLRSNTHGGKQARVTEYLRKQGQRLNSRVLSALAARTAADPFVKVKKMIKDLIVRLMEEANDEAEHKGWCDTELSTNEQTRKEKTKAVADLDAAMAEATEIRQTEKTTNTATIKDSQE